MKKYVKVFIYDYENNGKEIYIPEVSEIEKLVLKVISGDEVLDIFTKDGELLLFDANSSRKSQYLEAARILHKEEDLNSWVLSHQYSRGDSYRAWANTYSNLHEWVKKA